MQITIGISLVWLNGDIPIDILVDGSVHLNKEIIAQYRFGGSRAI